MTSRGLLQQSSQFVFLFKGGKWQGWWVLTEGRCGYVGIETKPPIPTIHPVPPKIKDLKVTITSIFASIKLKVYFSSVCVCLTVGLQLCNYSPLSKIVWHEITLAACKQKGKVYWCDKLKKNKFKSYTLDLNCRFTRSDHVSTGCRDCLIGFHEPVSCA